MTVESHPVGAYSPEPSLDQPILRDDTDGAIAVVGLDIKGPGDATNSEAFFDMLLNGRSALGGIPTDRFNIDAFYHPDQDRAGFMNVAKAHFLRENLAAFDAPFFSISPLEAACLDPQQRGLLECVYHALENAGISMSEVPGTQTSVFVGCSSREFDDVLKKDPDVDIKYASTGLSPAMLSNRVSWFYDLHGPSITLDTACSSSLNACHLACNSLKLGESSMAIVCGSNIMHSPESWVPMTNLGFNSSDGKCKSFDEKANGYSRGEGYGVVVLKRLSDAVHDGDTIRAVIRGTAANQDGRTPGITQPSKQAQMAAIRRAYEGLDPSLTTFFEAHGTGTQVGDSTEASAIASVFGRFRSEDSPLIIGALKSNIGHLEGAASIVGLIKTILSLEKGVIPPNIWFDKVNPKIPAKAWNLKFPTTATPWPAGLRRASINGFGFGGSNAHVVVDDALHYLEQRGIVAKHRTVKTPLDSITNGKPYANGVHLINGEQHANAEGCSNRDSGVGWEVSTLVSTPDGTESKQLGNGFALPQPRIFVLSAFDESGVERLATAYRTHISNRANKLEDDRDYLNDLCYTLARKRTSFTWRASFVADSLVSLSNALTKPIKPVRSSPNARLAFIFTGQGAQWYAMGRELLAYPVFESSIHAASRYLQGLGCDWWLTEELLKTELESSIDDPTFSQPICTALQIALVELLASWKVVPNTVIGHSSGEIAAAFAAGAISRESAWKLAYYRGVLSSVLAHAHSADVPRGMLAVALGPSEAQECIDALSLAHSKTTAIACINSPRNVTISGFTASLDLIKASLDSKRIFARKLKVDNAYHSIHMAPIADYYRRLMGRIEPGAFPEKEAPRFFSSLIGKLLLNHDELRKAQYWVDNLLSPVQFSDAVHQMISSSSSKARKLGSRQAFHPISDLLEIGPHAALRGPIREILDQIPQADDVVYECVLKRNVSAIDTLLAAACWLYNRGHHVKVDIIGQQDGATRPSQLLIDLPSYPFNHTKTYWNESRLSKGYRFRKFPRHELLGAPVLDWDEQNAIWRNWIRMSENPWIEDHRVTGSVLYPAAGMLVMAIEASRQVAIHGKEIKGIRFREVVFHRALQIPETTNGIETHFHLRPQNGNGSPQPSLWNEFELRSFTGDAWVEHCRGLITTEYETPHTVVDGGTEDRLFDEMCTKAVNDAENACRDDVSREKLYKVLKTMGLNFGPTFQTLSKIRVGDSGDCVATVSAADIATKMPHGYQQPHLIHPSTLDGLLHSVVAASTHGGKHIGEAMVPSKIKDLWIAADPSAIHKVHRLQASVVPLGLREQEASIISVEPTWLQPLVVIKGFVMTAITGNSAASEGDATPHLCFNIDWKPEPYLNSYNNAIKTYPPPSSVQIVDPTIHFADLEMLSILYLKRYMRSNPLPKVESMKPHHRKLVSWIQHQLGRFERGELPLVRPDDCPPVEDEDSFQALEARLDGSTAEASLAVAMGRSISKVLNGEADALEVIFEDGKADDFYRVATGADVIYGHLCSYIEALAHKDPSLRILEVGAGTGGATRWIMDRLMQHGEAEDGAPRFGSYDFTDISASFFEKAQETFASSLDHMNFKVLNIEHDPAQQGFELGQYDVVVAANALHATTDIDNTLANVRKLLKPGGKLVLYEITNLDLTRISFFGLLPGWWLSKEEHRRWTPLMTVPTWSKHMVANQFSGVDFSFGDFEQPNCCTINVMVSTAVSEQQIHRSAEPDVVIIVSEPSKEQRDIAQSIQSFIGLSKSAIISLECIATFDLTRRTCIFLAALKSPILQDLTQEHHEYLKMLTSSATGILWVTWGGGSAASDPTLEMVTGFARAIRSENPTLKFITLAVDSKDDATSLTTSVVKIFDAVFIKREESIADDTFTSVDGVIYIPRLLEANYMNKAIASKTCPSAPSPRKLGDHTSRALRLVVGSPGLLDTLHFDSDPVYNQPLQDHEVEIQMLAGGLNFRDVLLALGHVNLDTLGIEGAGIVTRTGPGSDFKAGDRVFGMVDGSMNTFARARDSTITKIPNEMSLHTAAGLTIVFVTAFCALYEIAEIQKGESVLIHAAAGGVGQACIQLAKLRGAKIFATVGSLDKIEILQNTYGIPRDHIFSSRDLTFARGIERMTGGRGVDVIVNSLSGAALKASWDCIAPCGRFIEIGKVDVYADAKLGMEKFKYNVRFQCLDIRYMGTAQPLRFKKILEQLVQLFEAGSIKELAPVQVFSFEQLHEAFHLLQSGKHSGKIILEPKQDDKVLIVPDNSPKYFFDPWATYVISGGLGGIGRSTAKWMVGRGARNLILLSRSGANRESAQKLVAELTASGATVMTPACDVSDAVALKRVLDDCLKTMPPVKGCLQGSMVLKDSLFANMTTDDFHIAVKPKVHASRNLHELLPEDMDFFIMLASGSGIVGRGGQANYCAGNTYQDALARHRVSNGMKATSIDLGIVLSVGYVAETFDAQQLRDAGYAELKENELHAMLDELCDPALEVSSPLKAQICLGFELPENIRARGLGEPWWVQEPLFRHLHNIRTTATKTDHGAEVVNHKLLLTAAKTREEGEAVIVEATMQKLSKALSIKVEDIDAHKPLHAYGVDSLVAVELRTWFLKELGAEIAVFDIMGESTIKVLGSLVAARSTLVKFTEVE